MKIQIQISLDLDLAHGLSTQEKIAATYQAVGFLVKQCGMFSKVDHTLFVTEAK
jgi:hypothetical protein